ncbi:hypothetical protein [Lacticaseibacillus paracasei]|uniref:Uncharacterized protein n=1 Tax=Lacticaseibacillus paracasei TaxID=1597 RepID=A0ABD5D0W2_LACPA|nr:hypothetical protein [Lacticaseibacillus paracasei]MDR7625728.1 hypothetical protein [Lacticaseibacillus paracasei]QPC12678.1 hypothetical protein LacP0245_10690 [Lacticaseibacillus paracasei subsp. tolerans]QUS97969.1 hypothetical protein KFU60_10715 [Lacticaseibacillus paracasei subsp. tolerans]WMX59772.1 hypothetical protein RF667_11675 [Lacticaseibacillus paracasei]
MNKNKQRVWAVGSMSVVAVAISAMAAVPRPARADEKPIAKGPPAPSVVSQTTISPVTATGDSNRLSISSQPKMQASDQQTSTVSVQAVNPVVIARLLPSPLQRIKLKTQQLVHWVDKLLDS